MLNLLCYLKLGIDFESRLIAIHIHSLDPRDVIPKVKFIEVVFQFNLLEFYCFMIIIKFLYLCSKYLGLIIKSFIMNFHVLISNLIVPILFLIIINFMIR
jgi:hypothetical protein